MTVPQHVLNWLYSILTSEYLDVNRTYNDVAQTLTRYPSFTPRTDVHTFPSGVSALLLHLSGTLPVNFRGNTYRFPMSIWVPHAYPREPPLVYVTPTDTIAVRPGQHVDPQGQVYHPYLVRWGEFWDKSTIHDFLAILSDVFAKEPPVISRQQQRPVASPQPVQSPPPVPPPPSNTIPRSTQPDEARPPPPPPKQTPGELQSQQAPPFAGGAGPAVPPVPSKSPSAARAPSRYDSAPPLPPQAQTQSPGPTGLPPTQFQQRPQDQVSPPQHQYQLSYPPSMGSPGSVQPPHLNPYPPQPQQLPQGSPHHMSQGSPNPSWVQNQPPPPGWNQHATQPPQPKPAPPPPPPDLIDAPLTLEVPPQSAAVAPPIPPNPEKDALLGQLARTLASLRQRSRQQNESSMAGLQAQRTAMLSVLPSIQSEMGQLNQLSNFLTSNTTILHEALHKADGVIEGSRRHPAPDIDELLVAPTVVSNQLYALVAEERALGDVIFMLGRAVERGRISPAVFAKTTRSLAREWYLKKALVRKIGLGMGLTP